MSPKWVKELFTLNKELTVGETDSVGTILNAYNNVVALLINTQSTEDYGGRFKFKGGRWFLFVFDENTKDKYHTLLIPCMASLGISYIGNGPPRRMIMKFITVLLVTFLYGRQLDV